MSRKKSMLVSRGKKQIERNLYEKTQSLQERQPRGDAANEEDEQVSRMRGE